MPCTTLQKMTEYLISNTALIVCKIHDVQLKERSIWITKYVFFSQFKGKHRYFFPIPRAPGPSPKKGCESPGSLFLYFIYLVSVTAGGPVSPRGHKQSSSTVDFG